MKINLWLPKGKHGAKGKSGIWDWHIHTTTYKTDHQQGLVLSTENSTQYSVRIYVGKEYEKEWIHVYV